VATHALSILVGKAPADWQPPDFTFKNVHLPPELPLRLPSELVHERPDIMAAESQLHAASAAIGVATANLYPSITLSANVTQQALSPGNLFNPASNAWALAAGLTAPIFSGGTLQAEKRGAEDAYQAALANYQQTVLQSFGQVADVLKAIEHDDAEIKAQRHALDTARSALKLARTSYKDGNSGILQVLDAERQYNEAQLAMTRVQAQQYQDTALLFLALGGGSLSTAK
jgi:NodT family efflux transporter outer membrane factor (OMF) lipoprotein